MFAESEKEEAKKSAKKTFTGIVVSTKNTKTALVQIESQRSDKRYKKRIKTRNKLMAHDEQEECSEGDFVLIEESKPISKRKAFVLKRIIRKAEVLKK
ncbi:MAG: 30S ribosomal protein S17 [Candidatus Caenarcaniphilales bacterium]|nr:30S ribosomal protein S17 [Candidatus Caenarcaniphilales bacterium]